MKVLMLSTDKKICDEHSEPSSRLQEYAATFVSIDVLVCVPCPRGIVQRRGLVRVFTIGDIPRCFSPFLSLWYAWRILDDHDAIVAQDLFETGLIAFFVSLFRKRKICVISQVHTDIFAPAFRKMSLKNRLRFFVARFLARHVDLLQVVSAGIKSSLIYRWGITHDKIHVLPVYISWRTKNDRQRGHVAHKLFPQTLLWVGRFEKEKNPLLAVEVLEKIKQRFPEAGLVYIGEGSLQKKITQEAGKRNLLDSIQFIGWQSDVRPYYEIADVLLVTSFFEGFCRVIVEAQVSGLPVISTDVGIAREAGAIVVPKESMHHAVIELLLNKNIKRNLDNAKKFILSPDEYRQRLYNIWKECLR